MTNRKQPFQLILFNGPPRCGKDTGVEHIVNNQRVGIQHMKLAAILKERTHALYGMPTLTYDHFEPVKDKKREEFLGLTPREAYINVAEKYFKPVHGETVFPELLSQNIRNAGNPVVAISDLGFDIELKYFVKEFGAENILLVKVHRAGCNFDNDSRNYVDFLNDNGEALYPGLQTLTIINSELDIYLEQLNVEVLSHLSGKGLMKRA